MQPQACGKRSKQRGLGRTLNNHQYGRCLTGSGEANGKVHQNWERVAADRGIGKKRAKLSQELFARRIRHGGRLVFEWPQIKQTYQGAAKATPIALYPKETREPP